MAQLFTAAQLQAISDALGDTTRGLTGPEIEIILSESKIADVSPGITKRHRIYNAFAKNQNELQDRINILAFIRKSMKPERHIRNPERFEPLRELLNQALAFTGLALEASGILISADEAKTISEATQRAADLRADLVRRGVHEDVLKFCRAELLAHNYFHAVLEAVKSVGEKLRLRTGLIDDGGTLVDRSLGGDTPLLAINSRSTKSEKDEQTGFANLIKGTFGMFRNPTAHAPKLNWNMTKEDAEDLLSLVSLIHRRLDQAVMPPRV